tara:strand:+ start:753 stop:1079 length:327 start_codon:yes stop_codon:yes gene_type:complete
LFPSSVICLKASDKKVSGKNCEKYFTQDGNEVIGKKTPDKNIIGSVTRLAIGAAVSSVLDQPDIASPIEINNIPPIIDTILKLIIVIISGIPWPIETLSKKNAAITNT